MKKILRVLLATIFVITPIIFINVSHAQEQENGPSSEAPNIPVDKGLNLSKDCLQGMGNSCFNYEKMVGLPDKKRTTMDLLQDVLLASSYMVGSVLTIVIIYCGLMYILASGSGKDVTKYKKGLIYAGIGALLVWGAYTIVKLLQYVAKG